MKRLPLKPCAAFGCPELIRGRARCDRHTQDERRRFDETRESSSARGYDGQWQKVRKIKLRRDPLCECDLVECGHEGRCRELATLVHHHEPIRVSPHKRLWMSNLKSSCDQCHGPMERESRRIFG